MADDEYNKKLESLQQYIPFLNNMIAQLKDPRKKNREQQLSKMVSLHSMITDKKKKLKLETLAKCEDVILKLYDKVKSGSQPHLQPPSTVRPVSLFAPSTFSPITPSSPSPPRDIPKTKPVVIPTEKVSDRSDFSDTTLSQPSSYKSKIDIYSSAADSLKSSINSKLSVFERLGKKAPDMSKPPISIEDLEALQEDVITERMSLNELTDLREKLQKQLKTDDSSSDSNRNVQINTTVRNTTILTKKAVDKPVATVEVKKSVEIKSAAKTAAVSKPVKVIKEATSIFGSTLSSIDNQILEGASKQKDKERRSSSDKSKERRSSKDEKKSDSKSSRDKDKERTDKHRSKDKKDGERKSSKDRKDDKRDRDRSKEHKSSSSRSKDEKDRDKEDKDKKKEELKNNDKKDEEEEPKLEPPKPVEAPPVYKRLADKYNPKPRKPTVEPVTIPDEPKKDEPLNTSIPFLETIKTSPTKLPTFNQIPLNIPLLSPTSSTNSTDNEIANFNKRPLCANPPNPNPVPQPVPPPVQQPHHVMMMNNPIMNNVVNQFKGRQTPIMPPTPNAFPTNQMAFPNNNYAPNNEMVFNQHQGPHFWSKQPQNHPHQHAQNFPQRSFTPIPNQFEPHSQPQSMDYYPKGSTPHRNQNHQAPPLLSPQIYHPEPRPPRQENAFNNKRDNDWRRQQPRDSFRNESRDPRLQQSRDPRTNYREDPRSTPRRDSREIERDGRSKFRDPRLNRFNSTNSREQPNRPRSRSRSRSREVESGDTFASPLDSLYSGNDGYRKTGKGYGVQNFKIPKIKREEESVEKEAESEVKWAEPEVKKAEPEEAKPKFEPEPQTKPELEEAKTKEPTKEMEENVASANVSSSTECDSKQETPPTEIKTLEKIENEKRTAEVGEISSTNDIPENTSRDEFKLDDQSQTEIINKFLKKLLENESTRAAAAVFIDNVSNSLDDEKLKKVVETVKSASVEDESPKKVQRKRVRGKRGRIGRIVKKKVVTKRKMRRRKRVIKDEDDDDEEDEEAHEEEEEKEEVLVTVGERIKSRKRLASTAGLKKKKHKTELDLLHEDIQDMFIRDGVLTATGKRMCRLLKNDAEAKPVPSLPQVETRTRRAKITSEKFDSKVNSDRLRVMSNVRVLLPKLSVEKMTEVDDDGQRYSLRRSKSNKSYVEEDSEEEKEKVKEIVEEKKEESEEEKEKEPEEKEKGTPKKVRKRGKLWSSGVIPKRKKKEVVVEEEPEKVENDVDKSTELVEPDKNYYSSKPWHFRFPCKLCSYHGKNIAKHYRAKHPDSEVLSSRLSPIKAEQAIKESLELKLDEQEDYPLFSTRMFPFKCQFCDLDMHTRPSNFFDHISTHTGEYRHTCRLCDFCSSNYKPLKTHYVKEHSKNTYSAPTRIKTRIYGYICMECHFVQTDRKTVENHVNVYHLGEGKRIMKIHLSSVPDHFQKKMEDRIVDEEMEEVGEEEIEEPSVKKKKIEHKKPETIVKKEKEIDMTVFTCNTDIQEENEQIEQERLRKMAELNESVKKTGRQCLNFVEVLSHRLLQEEREKTPEPPEVVVVKNEPDDDFEAEPLSDEPDPLRDEPEAIIEREPMLELSPKKPTKLVESPPTSARKVVQKDNTVIQGMITKLKGILKDEKGADGPPPLAPLLEKPVEDENVIQAGFMNATKEEEGYEYACRVPSCLFATKDRERFICHWNEDHIRINESFKMTKCKICQVEVTATDDNNLLRNFFGHVESEHLTQDQPVMAQDGPRSILRTRRLSGDKLSKSNEELSPELKDEDENPFPFKISGVMSLAEDPVPPLSPIRDKTPQKIESVILKEAKMNNAEKATKWKHPDAMKKFIQCPRELYKCPQYMCKFASNLRHLFENHVKIHVGERDDLVCCVYCDVKTPLSHAGLHMDLRHSNCLYSCSQCLYRALTREYVMVHIKLRHKETDLIISLPPKTAKTIMMSKQKRYTVKEACIPYKCGCRGCTCEFLFLNEYYNHISTFHKGMMVCGYPSCNYKCFVKENIVDHWRSHGCYHFHCLICKIGCMEMYTMLEHYSLTHPNMEPVVVDRRKSTIANTVLAYTDEAFSSVKYINNELLDSVNVQQCTVVPAENPVESPKSVSEPPKNVTLVPLSILQPNSDSKKIIAIFPKSVEGLVPKPIQLLTTMSVTKEAEPVGTSSPSFVFASISEETKDKEEVPAKDDPIQISEGENSTDVNTDPLSFENEEGGDESDTADNSELKSFGLIGYQLYRCAFCDISFSNARDFKAHTMNSKNCRTNAFKPYKCVHCTRLFKNPHGLLEHVQYHGQLRFCCSLCVKKFPSSFSLKLHMRNKHNVTNTITTPLIPNKTNLERDEFVIRPVPTVEPEPESSTSRFEPGVKDSYSPDEIEQVPKRYIFNSDVKCAICAYSTKVRTNLVRHLQFHSAEKSVPEIAPVNPVPCLDKNEKMFDKMTNLAISSFTGSGSGRMGGVKPEQKVEKEQVPAYVPSNRRYACCAEGCNYLCLEEANLRHHLFALHVQEPSFTCSHCKVNLKTDIEAFFKHLKLHDLHLYKCSLCSFVHNLRHKVDKHVTDKHPDKPACTLTVRSMEAELINSDQPNQQATPTLAGGATETTPAPNIKWTKPWHCGMCKYRCAAKNDIVTHIFNKHDINTQFKCTLCSYKTDEKKTFEAHFKENHPDNDIDIIYVYYKSEGPEKGAGSTQSKFDTTPLWQRDRPRIRHIRGILFEEASPQKATKGKSGGSVVGRGLTPTTSTSSTISNLDLSIEAVAKGLDETTSSFNNVDKSVIVEDDEVEEVKEPDGEGVIVIEDDEEEAEEVEVAGELMIDVESGSGGKTELKVDVERRLLSEEMLIKKYGKLCASISKGFRCPICMKFRTKKISFFVFHLLMELKIQRYKCKVCQFGCISFDLMLAHCQEQHENAIAANVIDIPLDLTVEYWLQMLIKLQAKGITQNFPTIIGEDNSSLTSKLQCEYCNKWFRNPHMLKDHELFHWAEDGYSCGLCCSEHPTLDELFRHSYSSHPSFEPSVNVNGPSVAKVILTLKCPPPQFLSTISTISSEEVQYACVYCSAMEKTIDLIQGHVTANHENEEFHYKVVTKSKVVEVMYACSYCHERGSAKFLKQHHNDKHTGLKYNIYQYICIECSGTFLNIKDLRSHFALTHVGKKLTYACVENSQSNCKEQYVCTKCPFRSGSVGGMRSHLRKHLRPIDCRLCGLTFVYPTEARAHHNKEHIHNGEGVEENKERLKEYEEIIKQIVSNKEGRAAPSARKMLARKSTGAPFVREYSYYGEKREEVDLKALSTSIE